MQSRGGWTPKASGKRRQALLQTWRIASGCDSDPILRCDLCCVTTLHPFVVMLKGLCSCLAPTCEI